MRYSARYALMLTCLCVLPPLYAAVEIGSAAQPLYAATTDSTVSSQPQLGTVENSTVVSESGIKAEQSLVGEDKTEQAPAGISADRAGSEKRDTLSVQAEDTSEKKTSDAAEKKEAGDTSFASIQNTGLTVADGDTWYYESFDRQGRQVFAVLYKSGSEIERTVWTYQAASPHPLQKKTSRATEAELIQYDEKGRELIVERYKGKDLASKTENIYHSGGKLMEQTITVGKNTDKSVWGFAGDKAVSQTKYRNGNKIAFIELHSEPHIIHLYFEGKEVFVGEEP